MRKYEWVESIERLLLWTVYVGAVAGRKRRQNQMITQSPLWRRDFSALASALG